MKRAFFFVAAVLALTCTLAVRASNSPPDSPADFVRDAEIAAALRGIDCGGESCAAVVRGVRAFFDRQLHGLGANGRSCADCHMAADQFQLSPANVEARYRFLQWERRFNKRADDPLFRAIDADDFRSNGEQANDFTNLRENGLIRIVLPLPPTMRLVDPATNAPSGEAFVDVWRMVPTIENVALTGPDGGSPGPRGPNHFGGYQLDARAATLQEQALGALVNHAAVQTAPAPRLLDDLASFERVVFSSRGVRALSDAVRNGVTPLPDPDPRLNAMETQGKAVFERACAQCHGGPGQSTTQAAGIPRFTDISTQCPRPVDTVTPARFVFAPCSVSLTRNVRTYQITLIDGTTARRTSSDPGRALLTGYVGGPAPLDDWNKFDIPQLRGISKTAPYFHNNSAATLEAVVDHYIAFFKRLQATAPPGVVPPPATTDGIHFDRQPLPEERTALLAYLRRL